MIEKHYVDDKLIKNFEFKFKFCIPNSSNTIEFIYDMPEISKEQYKLMVTEPWITESDTYFFNSGKLIIHNRAIYNY